MLLLYVEPCLEEALPDWVLEVLHEEEVSFDVWEGFDESSRGLETGVM
jgi:hypothetical protein